jgi:hypothetical protein
MGFERTWKKTKQRCTGREDYKEMHDSRMNNGVEGPLESLCRIE